MTLIICKIIVCMGTHCKSNDEEYPSYVTLTSLSNIKMTSLDCYHITSLALLCRKNHHITSLNMLYTNNCII